MRNIFLNKNLDKIVKLFKKNVPTRVILERGWIYLMENFAAQKW